MFLFFEAAELSQLNRIMLLHNLITDGLKQKCSVVLTSLKIWVKYLTLYKILHVDHHNKMIQNNGNSQQDRYLHITSTTTYKSHQNTLSTHTLIS